MTIEELAEQIRKDAYRVKELQQALSWLDRADDEVSRHGASVNVDPSWIGPDRHSYYAASLEIARHYEKLYPQAIALVREMCRHELERINARYLPLLMPVSQGSEA